MTRNTLILLFAGALGVAQPPVRAESELHTSARAVNIRVSLCQVDEDFGQLTFDLTVELRNEQSTPILIYRMLDQDAQYIAIATSLENATHKQFYTEQTASVYVGDEDVVTQMTRESFVRLAPSQPYRIQVKARAFVVISSRSDQLRSGTYWIITNIRTWPNNTTVRPETLNLGDLISEEYLRLEPAEFSIMVPSTLQACE